MVILIKNGQDENHKDVLHFEDPGAEQAEHADGVQLEIFK